jgi:hypothetical protein
MEERYFKFRKAWRPKKHKFDLGGFLKIEPLHVSGYLVVTIFNLKEKEHLPFYHYHLHHYFKNNPQGAEHTFLAKIIEYIDKDIRSRETLHYYKTITKTRIHKLIKFREALKHVDKWEVTLTNEDRIKKSVSYVQEIMDWQNVNDTRTVLSKLLFDEVGSDKFFIEYKNIIEEKNSLEILLEKRESIVKDLQTQLNNVAPNHKIAIQNGDQKLLIDLFQQLRKLNDPETGRDFLSAKPELWAKLIHNYFELTPSKNQDNSQKPLSYDTILDYFKDNLGKEMNKAKNRGKYFNIKEYNNTYTK